MRPPRRSFVLGLVCSAVALGVLVVPVLAAELLGTIKSVDADNNKFVVTSVDGKDVTVTVTHATEYENAKGKVSKKSQLTRLNPGGNVKVIHEDGTASRVILNKGAVKKKDTN
jgi:ABC-type lipoprotein release transport system permease subunit